MYDFEGDLIYSYSTVPSVFAICTDIHLYLMIPSQKYNSIHQCVVCDGTVARMELCFSS